MYLYCPGHGKRIDDFTIIKPNFTRPYTIIPPPNSEEKEFGFILVGTGLFLWFCITGISICCCCYLLDIIDEQKIVQEQQLDSSV